MALDKGGKKKVDGHIWINMFGVTCHWIVWILELCLWVCIENGKKGVSCRAGSQSREG